MRRIIIGSALLLFMLLLVCWRVYNHFTTYDVVAKFNSTRPLPHNINVLYKGLKIGDVVSVKHSKDFENTLIKLRLPKSLELPANVVANLMIEKRRFFDFDYIELEKTDPQSDNILSEGMEINGVATIDAKNYFANQNKENLDEIKNNLYLASEGLKNSLEGLSELIVILKDVVNENRASLKHMSRGFATTGNNLELFTQNLDDTFDKVLIQQTLNNLNGTSGSFYALSENLRCEIPMILKDVRLILDDIEEVTNGVSAKLKEPFGGMKVLLGKSID